MPSLIIYQAIPSIINVSLSSIMIVNEWPFTTINRHISSSNRIIHQRWPTPHDDGSFSWATQDGAWSSFASKAWSKWRKVAFSMRFLGRPPWIAWVQRRQGSSHDVPLPIAGIHWGMRNSIRWLVELPRFGCCHELVVISLPYFLIAAGSHPSYINFALDWLGAHSLVGECYSLVG